MERKATFGERILESFPELEKDVNPYIKNTFQVLGKINKKNSTPRYIIMKFRKHKTKTTLKLAGEERQKTHEGAELTLLQ